MTTQGITYKFINSDLLSYTDTDWGDDQNSRKSIDVYLFLLFKDSINWLFKHYQTVTLSFTEAEYMMKIQAIKKAIWLCCFLYETDFCVINSVKARARACLQSGLNRSN